MKLALGLDVQTNAKGGKFMSIEDSHQGALVCKADVEALREPGNFQDDGAKRVGVCFVSNTDLELWTEEVEQGVIDNMIVFQKPFLGAAAPGCPATASSLLRGRRACRPGGAAPPAPAAAPRSASAAAAAGSPSSPAPGRRRRVQDAPGLGHHAVLKAQDRVVDGAVGAVAQQPPRGEGLREKTLRESAQPREPRGPRRHGVRPEPQAASSRL